MKRSPMKRSTPLRSRAKPKPSRRVERTPAVSEIPADDAKGVWYASASTLCQHPACAGESVVLAQHHVVYEQKVRREGGAVWDPRNALTLCDLCHTSHHRRGSKVVPLSALTDGNYAFAVELLGAAAFDYLRRRYVGDDPRLDRILERHYPRSRT